MIQIVLVVAAILAAIRAIVIPSIAAGRDKLRSAQHKGDKAAHALAEAAHRRSGAAHAAAERANAAAHAVMEKAKPAIALVVGALQVIAALGGVSVIQQNSSAMSQMSEMSAYATVVRIPLPGAVTGPVMAALDAHEDLENFVAMLLWAPVVIL